MTEVHKAELVAYDPDVDGRPSTDADEIRAIVQHGRPITLQLMPGVIARARPFIDGDRIGLEFMSDTPLGPVGGTIYTTPKTFERMVNYVEENPETLKEAGLLLESVTGHRPLLAR